MSGILPTLDLLTHNAVAVLVAVLALVLLSQLAVSLILRAATWVLRSSVFEGVTAEERASLRKRVQRMALTAVSLLGALLLIAAVVASYRRVRALDLALTGVAWIRAQDFAALQARLLTTLGIAIGALLTSAVLRAIAAALGKGLSRWRWLVAHAKALPEVVTRLQAAIRAVIGCAAAILIARALELPQGAQHTLAIVTDVVVAFYVSRAASQIWHLVTDVGFSLPDKVGKLEGPLKILRDLKHLRKITKRVGDYLIYVGATTWVVGRIWTESWYYSAGQIGLRLIVIFYASRVLVEACVLLVQTFFLGKVEELTEPELQRRRTLLPVIVGFLRYSIYFTGLIMGLREASIDPTPLLAGAGVIGVAIGFGAQTFVGDIVAGFFILFEDLVLVGDLVQVGAVKGNIEEIGVRITRIRDDAGVLHSIPNGEVRKVANHSRAYVNAIVDVHVPYEEDPRRVRVLLSMLAERVLEEQGVKRGPVEVKVQELSEGSILLRLIARVPPGKDEDVSDVLRERVVEELRAAKVGAPRPRRAVIVDSVLHVGAPAEPEEPEEEEDAGPREPFKPEAAD